MEISQPPYRRTYDKRVRVGVVGAGSHSYRNLLSSLTYLPVDLVGIADVDAEVGARTAAEYGVSAYASAADLYRDAKPEAVLLCVSPQLHPELAIEAFGAGMHVWMEKPVACTAAEVETMITARADLVGVVGFKKAFMPATWKVLELLALPEAQPLRTTVATYPMSIPRGDRAFIDERKNHKWLVDGCHPLAYLLRIGGPVAEVVTHRGPDDSGFLVLRHEGGHLSTLVLAHGAPPFQPVERYQSFAGKVSVEVTNSRKVTYQRGIAFDYGKGVSFAPPGLEGGAVVWEAQDGMNTMENKAIVTQGMFHELHYFLDCVLEGRAAEVGSLEFALDLMRVYEAAILSDGAPVAP